MGQNQIIFGASSCSHAGQNKKTTEIINDHHYAHSESEIFYLTVTEEK